MRKVACEIATVNDKMSAWVEHFDRLLNLEFDGPSETFPETASVAG